MRAEDTPRRRPGALLYGLTFLLAALFAAGSWGSPASAACEDWSSCQACHYEAFVTTDFHHTVLYRGGGYNCSSCHYVHGCMYVCSPCHGDISNYQHANANHASTPGSGAVVLFPDDWHDDAGWTGSKPYFAVPVDCAVCHETDLAKIHGSHCATCHPSPYNTLGTWNGTCQQGGCHSTYHGDSTKAHAPFENPYDPDNDCLRCHDQNWDVTQSSCVNCHAAPGCGYGTAPVTTSNVQPTYAGPAKVDFSLTADGKVALGRTFYKLDGGTTAAAAKSLFVSAAGSHALEFWSVDQAGNNESVHRTASFTVVADTTPPTTTSDARASYSDGAIIALSASDASTLGVKATYYRLNGGATQTGTSVVIPAATGTVSYSLAFWSEDWSGNVESQKTANFTVSSGSGVLRLIWGDSDVSGSPCSYDPEASARWTVRSGEGGPVVASGAGGCPGWSGVADVPVSPGATPYAVLIEWWDSWEGYYDQTYFPSVLVTAPGQVVPVNY